MDSLPFSQSDLSTQGEGPCFMVMNSQLEDSEERDELMRDVIFSNMGTTGPHKQRMLWDLTALRGTQPSPVLTTGKHFDDEKLYSRKMNIDIQNKEFKGRTVAGSEPMDQQQDTGTNTAPNQADGQHGNTAGNDGDGNQGNEGQDAAGGAGGDGGNDGNGGDGGDGGGGGEEDEEEHEETGEDTSQDTNSSNSSIPKLVTPPAINTPPRTVRVTEIIDVTSPSVSSDQHQSEDDQGVESERGSRVSDAPTAIVGDSPEERQEAVTTPSTPREGRPSEEQPGGPRHMDPPLHWQIPKKRTSDSHSSSISSSSSSHHSNSYLASHDSASSSLISSLTSSSSCGDGLQATSSKFTHIKEHPPKPTDPIPPSSHHGLESLRREGDGEAEMEHPQSSQQDLFSEITEERKDEALGSEYHSELQSHQQGGRILENETSTSDDASITIIQPSPEAWGTVIANTPPNKIEQYSRSIHSTEGHTSREDSDRNPSTPSESIGSLHLSGHQVSSPDSILSIIPPSFGAYGQMSRLIPSTPTPQNEEEPMGLSIPDDEDGEKVAVTTHPPKGTKSTRQEADDDEYTIPEWQQALNREQLGTESRSSSRTSSSNNTGSSQQSAGRSSAQGKDQQLESFQAWQPSSQPTTSVTSEEQSRSRPPSTAVRLGSEELDSTRRKKPVQGEVAEKPRSVSATGRILVKESSNAQKQKSLSQPETTTIIQPKYPDKHPSVNVETAAHPTSPQSHRGMPRRSQDLGDDKTSVPEASKRGIEIAASSYGRRTDNDSGEAARVGGSSEEWLLHYTPTQTETETEAEEGTRKGFVSTSMPRQQAATPPGKGQSMKAPRDSAVMRPDAQATGRPIHGMESQSVDPTEYSSIDFHLSLPTDGGFRPDVGTTLPSLVSHEKRRSSRQPIRHSTPIMDDESPDRAQGQEGDPEPPKDQRGEPPKLAKTSTLTLSADTESDTQNGTELPVFQLARPADAEELLKSAYESPGKKSTSVFSRVQATKMATGQAKVKGQTQSNGTAKNSESDDLFAFSQRPAKKTAEESQQAALLESEKQMELDDDDNEATIPVHYYQEKEDEDAGMMKDRRKEVDKRTIGRREKETTETERIRRRVSERTPEKVKQDQPKTPSSNRLTRSGRKRMLPEGKTEDNSSKKRAAKMTRFDKSGETTKTSSTTARDPYDFSDSQSNKTPSPMKKAAQGTGQPAPKASPALRGSLPRIQRDQTKGASSAQQRAHVTMETVTTATVPSAGLPSTSTTPKRAKHPGTKSTPVTRTTLTRGRQTPTTRPRLASPQVHQTQLAEDSSPELSKDMPIREKKGVKFRKSPRKKPPQEKPLQTRDRTTDDPPQPPKKLIRRICTRVYRIIQEEIIIDGKVVKTWETREEIEPVIETVEEEDIVDTPSPARSGSSLTSGSLGDISSMYSKTSSTPSLVKTLSGSTLSKQSSFSSISHTSSKMGSPGSDKSTPSLTRCLSSPGSDKSAGNEKSGEKVSPSDPTMVSFTRSKTYPSTRTSSSSDGESRLAVQTTEAIFQKPQQTPRRKVDQLQSLDVAKRLSLTGVDDSKSPDERSPRGGHIPAAKVAQLVQRSQADIISEGENGHDQPSNVGPEIRTSRRQVKFAASTSSSSPLPVSSPSERRPTRTSSAERTTPSARSLADTSHVDKRTSQQSQGSARSCSPTATSVQRTSKTISPVEMVSEVHEDLLGTVEKRTEKRHKDKTESSPDSGKSTPRSSRGRARSTTHKSTTHKSTPAPSSPRRLSIPPQQSTIPSTSEPSTSVPSETLYEPPPSETLPVAEGEAAVLLPGLKVYTKWLDGFWYPGTIHHQERLSRYVIEFDDGDHRTVNEADVIIKEWLSKGQSVMAEDSDGYYYAGIIVGYYRDPDTHTSGYVIEQTVSHETCRYERRRVILNKDQAARLVSSTSGSSSTSGNNIISLDNIVYSKRTRIRSRVLDTPGSSSRADKPQLQSPRQQQKTTPSRQGVKRKLVPSEEQQRKETPSPKKRGRPTMKAATPAASSLDLTTSPRRSPRKHQQQQQQPPTEETSSFAAHMGALPKNASLFHNYAFLVTHGEVRQPTPKEKSSSESTDDGSGEDEVEMVLFDRAYAMQQIQRGGGLVLSDFNKSQITKMKVLLIANTHCRTKKYFQALAAGIPCISHLWLRDCCKTGKLQNHKNYLLPAGESLEENALMEIQPNRCILAGMSVYMVSDYEGVQDSWRSILIAAGCHMVSKIPSHLDFAKNPDLGLDCNVIVTDPSCPRSLLHRAHLLKIPVVSCEWVIQCLVNGVRVPYQGHDKYTWNYRDKSAK